jgi:hypothetical protein
MNIINNWKVAWTLDMFPKPNDPHDRRRSVVKINDWVEFIDQGNDQDVVAKFLSYAENGPAGSPPKLIEASIRYDTEFDGHGNYKPRYDRVVGQDGAYYISATVRSLVGKEYITGWISYDTGSQDSGGQWGSP